MTTIGSTPSLRYTDRAAYAQLLADNSKGQRTVEEVTEQLAEVDRLKLQGYQSYERFLAGEGIYTGSYRGGQRIWDPEGRAQTIELAQQARSERYARFSGPVTIEALNVDSAVSAQGKLTGGDLKNLSYYADYLRNEVAAATQAKGEVTFTGAWGKDRVTNDVGEYISWLFEAARLTSQV